MTAYSAEAWTDLFVASAGAAAALAGLVFVAVSANIRAIMKTPGLPERSLSTVLLLLSAVVVSIFGLSPQPRVALGVEVAAVGLVLIVWLSLHRRAVSEGSRPHPAWIVVRTLLVAPGNVAYCVAGVSLCLRAGGGLLWLMAGIVLAIVGSVISARVLLVEVLR